jgi:Major Facilitator Superfamily
VALLGVAGLAAFLVRERRAAAPMLPLSIFRERQFAATSAVTFIVYGALTGATFLFPLVLRVVSGYSPLASGLALVPLTVIMLALSARSGQLATQIGPRLQLSAGPLMAGVGLAMLTFSTSGSSYVTSVLPAVVVPGLGLAITIAPLTATAMSSAPAQHAGIASAINNDLARFGGLLAVAVLPTVRASPARPTCTRTRSPPDSGPRRSSRAGCAPPAACSPPSRSPIRSGHPGPPGRPSPRSACTAASMRRH